MSQAWGWEQPEGAPRRRPDIYGYPTGEPCCWTDAYRVPRLRKTMLCSYFMAGRCRRGGRCSYAHGEEELVAVPKEFLHTKSLSASTRQEHR